MILRLMMPIFPLIKVKAWFIIHFANQKHLVNAINNNTKYLLKF